MSLVRSSQTKNDSKTTRNGCYLSNDPDLSLSLKVWVYESYLLDSLIISCYTVKRNNLCVYNDCGLYLHTCYMLGSSSSSVSFLSLRLQ